MNILLLNQNWFAPEFRELGHRVISFGRHPWLEIKQEKFLISWSEIKAELPEDFIPDLLIVNDDSSPVLVTEQETIDIPSMFYSVDTHHHLSLHRYLGLSFTHLFVAQKDYIKEFDAFSQKPHWLPLYASIYMEPKEQKSYGAVFLGTLDQKLNPDRVQFFDRLKKLVPVDVRTAPFCEIFPLSQIIINQTVKGDLNFRVFEAMMSGALLITEQTGNGLTELFEDGKDLVLYKKGDVEEAAQKIKYYLDNPDEARKIGLAGRKLICEKHLAKHRAEFILSKLDQPTRPFARAHCFALIHNFAAIADILRSQGETLWRSRAFLETMRLTQLGLQAGDRPDPTLALDIMRAVLALETILGKKLIQDVLEDLRATYPDLTIFHLVRIDQLSSDGETELAIAMAQGLCPLPPEQVIKQAEEIVRELRN